MQVHQRFAARNGIAALRSPRFPNMRDRRIVVHTTEYVWDDEGDIAETYRPEGEVTTTVIGCEPDQWDHWEGDHTAAHVAANHLRAHYVWQHDVLVEPFMPGGWYSLTDKHPYENRETETSFHLHGFTPSEEARVHRMLRKIGASD